ncbi:uncharacterized protein TNCV_4065121 [Trichonephila clavipes]|uniref:Retrotransposon gag domain-containing protein n=1 Tax=Trichonephila clavipes TaxID=2585209 RepID=A0A8X6W9J4_TRICX|nr:uncharacterized protein TNCV_4065121 [Trichonephila clavipes]
MFSNQKGREGEEAELLKRTDVMKRLDVVSWLVVVGVEIDGRNQWGGKRKAVRHLMGRALDWYQIFGLTLVQNTATDFAQLKASLSKAFPAIQNKKESETRFYVSQQRQNQEPTDFVYDLLKKKEIRTGDV